MNITPLQPNPQYTTAHVNHAPACATDPQIAPLTVADITGDIERLISKTIAPYIDPTSFALNAEDLRGECRAKLARIISDGRLAKCPTRAKAFAFIKVAFRNHVTSLVQKHVFPQQFKYRKGFIYVRVHNIALPDDRLPPGVTFIRESTRTAQTKIAGARHELIGTPVVRLRRASVFS
jgi:hypothetical protein